MKKFFIVMSLMAMAVPLAFADYGVNPGHSNRTTYYGTEASTNANNPCKGATIRVCAIVDTNVEGANGNTKITKIVRAADGKILSVTQDYVPGSPSQVMKEEMANTPSNAKAE